MLEKIHFQDRQTCYRIYQSDHRMSHKLIRNETVFPMIAQQYQLLDLWNTATFWLKPWILITYPYFIWPPRVTLSEFCKVYISCEETIMTGLANSRTGVRLFWQIISMWQTDRQT